VAVAAGQATLAVLQEEKPYDRLATMGRRLAAGLSEAGRSAGRKVQCAVEGSLFTLFFASGPVTDLASAKRSDTAAFARFFHAMLEAGFYLPPSQFEAGFVSMAHTNEDIDRFVEAANGGQGQE
jgi:glutamate-1-semialdehyde 2,1-aminomutase